MPILWILKLKVCQWRCLVCHICCLFLIFLAKIFCPTSFISTSILVFILSYRAQSVTHGLRRCGWAHAKCWAQESPRAQSAEMQAWKQVNLWAEAGFTLSGVRAETSVEPLPVLPKKIGRFIQSFTWSLWLTERGLCLQSNDFFFELGLVSHFWVWGLRQVRSLCQSCQRKLADSYSHLHFFLHVWREWEK